MKGWKGLLFPFSDKRGTKPKRSEEGRVARNLAIWRGTPPWLAATGGKQLHLGRTVCRELSRTVCAELTARCADSAWLEAQAVRFLRRFPETVSAVCGCGSVMLRLYPGRGGIYAETVLPDRYEVRARGENGEAIRVCFSEEVFRDKEHYLRCEEHGWEKDGSYLIQNRLYRLEGGDAHEVPLTALDRFASYPAQMRILGLKTALFVEWRLGLFEGAGEGRAIYEEAIDLMEDADRQYERLLWEFEGGELAVDASEDAFRADRDGNPTLPLGKDRLFRMNLLDGEEGGLFRVFSPALRDESLIRGLNRILMFFEDAVGVARGTVSDPAVMAKTATEIRMSTQRTHLTVKGLREEAKSVLGMLFQGMWQLGLLYRLVTPGAHEVEISFGDGVLEVGEEEAASVPTGKKSTDSVKNDEKGDDEE